MSARPPRWAGAVVIAATMAVLLAWTWGKWPDALIDFGRELYVPWRILEGQRLYGDLEYFNGPLSPHLNAVWFAIVGPSLRALVLLNAAVCAVIAAMLYGLLCRLCDRYVAVVGSLSFLVFFGFGQFMPGGNYNYLAPYSHEMTHGVALSLAALVTLGAYLRSGARGWLFATGLAGGCAVLTKAEFAIAVVPAIAIGLALRFRAGRSSERDRGAPAVAIAGFVIPPLLAWLALSIGLGPARGLRGVAGSWIYLFDERLRALPFYRDVQGTLDLGESWGRIAVWLGRYAAVFLPAAGLASLIRRDARESRAVAWMVAAGAAALVLVGRGSRDWHNLARPFPVLLGAAVVALALARWPEDAGAARRRVLGLCCAVFAWLLLVKTILNVSIVHYGFVLAMPAGVTLIALAVGVVPEWFDRRGASGRIFRAAALGALAGFAVVQIEATKTWLDARTFPMGTGADRFLVHGDSRGIAEVLSRVEALRRPPETLVVVPEGVMLNYLLRAENPTGVVNFLPPELIMFGEARILERFREAPPDWIVLVNRGVSEYGYRFFGDDYARELYAWIEAGYEVVDRVTEINGRGQPQPLAAILRRSPALRGG